MGFQSLYLLHKPHKSLWQIVQKTILDKILSGTFIFVICCVLKILTIPYMTKLIEWYDKSETTSEEDFHSLTSIGIIITLLCLRASLLKMATIRVGKASIIAEMNLLCLVQHKILNLKFATSRNIQGPKISDVFSKDLARLKHCIENFHQLVDFVVILTFSTVVLYMDLQILSLLIPGLFLTFLIIQVKLNRRWIKNYRQHLEFFDMRISTLRDMLNTIKLIKINSWELVMEYFINKKRVDEKAVIKKMHGLKELQECLILIFPYQVMFLIVYLYIKFYNEPLQISQVYSIMLYTILLAFSLRNVCHWMLNFKLSKELFRRLGSLTQMGDYVKPEDDEFLEKGGVVFTNASFAWTSPENTKATVMMNNDSKNAVFFQPTGFINQKIPTVLTNLDYQFKARSLTGVIGCRESGKSSLLYSIMTEMITTDGSINTNGRMAYVPEEPVLLSGTSIRANIVFGSPYDPHKYDKVIFICQLRGLFIKYILGDYSKIGDRNINLSKSIRARISLARAVYSDADIFLIDNIWKH
jgi:ABC-type multidrug transport system fused ATPase/permease subunit